MAQTRRSLIQLDVPEEGATVVWLGELDDYILGCSEKTRREKHAERFRREGLWGNADENPGTDMENPSSIRHELNIYFIGGTEDFSEHRSNTPWGQGSCEKTWTQRGNSGKTVCSSDWSPYTGMVRQIEGEKQSVDTLKP